MSRVLLGPIQRVADEQLYWALPLQELHALGRHSTHVRDVADLVPRRTEEESVGDVVLPVEDREWGDFQSPYLAPASPPPRPSVSQGRQKCPKTGMEDKQKVFCEKMTNQKWRR